MESWYTYIIMYTTPNTEKKIIYGRTYTVRICTSVILALNSGPTQVKFYI